MKIRLENKISVQLIAIINNLGNMIKTTMKTKI